GAAEGVPRGRLVVAAVRGGHAQLGERHDAGGPDTVAPLQYPDQAVPGVDEDRPERGPEGDSPTRPHREPHFVRSLSNLLRSRSNLISFGAGRTSSRSEPVHLIAFGAGR